MGRSVSYPTDCTAVCFRDVMYMGYPADEETGETDFDQEPDSFLAQIEFNDFVDMIRYEANRQWKSLVECDRFLDREDRAIMENDFCYIGVSEYCGLAAIWLKSKGDELRDEWYSDSQSLANLADAWCARIEKKFHALFGEYVKTGTMSNGCGVYEKAA